MILSKRLRNEKKISHGFFNKNGGSSNGIYRSLNCGPGSNDKKNKIKKNLRIVKNKFGRKTKNIFLVHQIHSNKFIYIDEKFKSYKKKFKVDAIIDPTSTLDPSLNRTPLGLISIIFPLDFKLP